MKKFRGLTLFTLIPLAALHAAVQPPIKRNILHIHADDHRADGLHALGTPLLQTPNLDALVERGMTFTHCYTMGSMIGAVCTPSRTMMLTGRSWQRIPGAPAAAANAKDPATFLPRVLAAAGYQTWHMGKYGNGFPAGLAEFATTLRDEASGKTPQDDRAHCSQRLADGTIKFLKARAEAHEEKPFYIYIAPPVPHDPRSAEPQFQKLYDPAKIPLSPAFLPHHPFDNGEMTVRDEKLAPWPRTEADTKQQNADYYSCVTGLDHHIGRIFAALKASGQWDNTIIIFSSDNGLSLGEHGLFGKQNLYEFGGMHVPLVMAGPGIPQGRSEALVYLMDLFPTFAEFAGAKIPAGVDGQSIVPILNGQQTKVRNVLYTGYRNSQRAIRDDRWKLIRYPLVDRTQLFDLSVDPHELINLADQPQHQAKLAELTAGLKQEMAAHADGFPLTVANPKPAAWSAPVTSTMSVPPRTTPTAAPTTAVAADAAVTIHVSPTGNDTNPGTANKPLATLTAAQQRVRQSAGRNAVTVLVHGGTYYLPDALRFAALDSGTKEFPVVYSAAPGETPVISGGSRLALTWERSANRPGVFQASVPGGLEIDQLFVNGLRQWMARFPNRESGEGLNVFDTWMLDHKAKPDPARNPLAPERVARWADPAGAYFHAMHPLLWGGIHWRVTGKKPDGSLAMEGGTQNNRGAAFHGVYRMIEHVLEELDAPGEWFHDRKANTLYCFPPIGTDLAKATVETVRLRHLIEVQGTPNQPVKWVQFRGLTFLHTARTFMETKEPLLRSDWTIYRGGAVFLTGTEDCEVADCTFDQLGGNAVFVNNYNRRATIRGCLIAEAGANGICFVGDPAAVRNALFNYDKQLGLAGLDRTPGPKSDNYPADCLVEDCLIYRIGRVEKQTATVEISMSQAITVRHCSLYDVPRAGINIGDGCWGGHVIEFCDVFDTVMETGDHGSFNSWGRDRFWTVKPALLNDDAFWSTNRELPFLDTTRSIVLRNNRWRCDHGWDIDLDDGASNYEIRNNLCLSGGIKNREGFGRVVENNVITASGFHPHVWYKHSGDIFRRNIMATPSYLPARMGKPPWGAELDFNLLHVAGLTIPKPAPRLAQQSGRDTNSLMADAQFVDPARGDFRVRDGSPALKLGFTNFPMDQFGVQKPSLKALARTPSFAQPIDNSAVLMFAGIIQWQGAKVKNLETIEEASSLGLGLDTDRVWVLEVPAAAFAAKLGLQPGDLIVSLGGQPIKNVADLQRLTKSAEPADLQLEIIRNRGRQTLKIHAQR